MASEHETSKAPSRVEAKKNTTVKHKLHRVTIEKAKNGGYTVEHHYRQDEKGGGMIGGYKEPETHVFADFTSMAGHLPKAFSEKLDAKNPKGKEELPE